MFITNVSEPALAVGWRERVRRRLVASTGAGLPPERVARALALGSVIGLAPIIWGATPVCLLAARLLRWPVLPLQAGNWLVYPLQLLLLVPFYQGGQVLLAALSLHPTNVGSGLLINIGIGQGGALLLWLLLAPILFLLANLLWRSLCGRLRNV